MKIGVRLSLIFLVFGSIFFLPVIFAYSSDSSENSGGFCGTSTKGYCNYNSDCKIGGCSGQVCENRTQSSTTTCEYLDCYNKVKYNMNCGCFNNKCKWISNETEIEDDDNEIECDNHTYSNCPNGCIKKCVSSSNCDESNESCIGTADCDGEGSCYEKEDKEWKRRNITKEEFKEAIKEKNRIKFENKTGVECPDECKCTGVVMKCELEDGGREMTVYARSGNIIFQVKNINATTQVTLYQHNKTVYAVFKNNETKTIILPDEVKARIIAKLKTKAEIRNITLDENGTYYVMMKKKARLFWIIPVDENADGQVDAQTGQVIVVKGPWWGFLAKDVKEEQLLGASCGTVTPGTNNECCQNKGYSFWDESKAECTFSGE
ncbi:MAG: eight-cysteine-cluster domain-containing protein [Candidatus Pacearchaeota archaeon]